MLLGLVDEVEGSGGEEDVALRLFLFPFGNCGRWVMAMSWQTSSGPWSGLRAIVLLCVYIHDPSSFLLLPCSSTSAGVPGHASRGPQSLIPAPIPTFRFLKLQLSLRHLLQLTEVESQIYRLPAVQLRAFFAVMCDRAESIFCVPTFVARVRVSPSVICKRSHALLWVY